MKVTTILSLSALFMASLTAAVMPDDPNKIDTCTKPGVVAWTFDDGPGKFNDKLLAILAKRNIKATFFVLGQMIAQDPNQAASLKKMLDAGHQLASHTYTHSILDKMTPDAMKKEITDTSDIMFKHAGVRPAYMRAPQGECGPECTKVMEGMGLVVSHWNVDTNDWRFTANAPDVAVKNSMEELTKVIINESNPQTDSFILLQHEIHQFSVDLLADKVADAITAKGYRFVTMEECIGKPAYLEGSAPAPGPGPAPGNNTTTPTTRPSQTSGGAAKPSPSAGGNVNVGNSTGNSKDKKPDSGASVKQLGAWAMGLAAVAGALLL